MRQETSLTYTMELRKAYPSEWRSWQAMFSRTRYRSQHDWKHYGGKPISVEEAGWRDFSIWLADVGPKPEPQSWFTRKNKTLGYTKQNCCWAPASESHPNKTKTHCWRGHSLTGENLIPYFLERGRRQCRTCQTLRERDKYATKKKQSKNQELVAA